MPPPINGSERAMAGATGRVAVAGATGVAVAAFLGIAM